MFGFYFQLKDDPKFHEFLEAHKNVGVKPVWTNDAAAVTQSDNEDKEDTTCEKKEKLPKKEERDSEDEMQTEGVV